ncbi:MAG: glycosyltransferase family 2 protein [Chloroflexi bacterium]|nr:glycosyltransferase family 2 protein [Chloroflexota bacterium]
MLDLAIVILNWNTRDLLRECLRSIFASDGDFSFRVCVIDNASTDASAEMALAQFPQAMLIRNPVNSGYAVGNNLGLRAFGFQSSVASHQPPVAGNQSAIGNPPSAIPRYALLLNPDTVLPPAALADMLAYMEAHPEAGAAGPKLVLLDGSLDLACRRSFPTPEVSFYRMVGLSKLLPSSRRFGRYNMTFLDPNVEAEVDSVVGAFMLVRGEAIRQVGLLDEQFFMYGEDLDWAFRIKQAGWKIYYNPAVRVQHVKRAASRLSTKAQNEFYRAMLLFFDKHYRAHTPGWVSLLIAGGIHLQWRLALLRQKASGEPA